MGRRKIEIKAIKDDRNRSVTFLKRKGGLFKKAHELAVLCSVDVAVIIFGHNKKLYEFSSCDMRESLTRYQYFGPPHEHKGPDDFNGKRDDDDEDEDDATPAPDELHLAHPNPPQMMGHPGFQHVNNHAPSASPPMHNGMHFDPRHGTPQPQGSSRPSSRNHLRRVSSNLGGPPHHGTPPPPPPPSNSFTYIPNPSMYNPNAPHSMGQHPPRPPNQFAHFGHHPPGPHHQPHPSQHQSMPPHSMPPQSMPPQPIPQHAQAHSQHLPPHPPHPPHPIAQHPPTMTISQPPPPPPPMPQPYLPDQKQQQPQRNTSLTETSTESIPTLKMEATQSPPHIKPLSKSRSIFTPIDDHGSVLARHFGFGDSTSVKIEPMQHNIDERRPLKKKLSPPPRAATEAPLSKATPDLKPPVRTNSGQMSSKRPQLKVQIPSESSDRGSATAESSSSAGNKAVTPSRPNPDAVVLPPPSPSAGPILSAGASGPPNPFARPPPPGAAAAAHNNNAYNNNNNIDTPLSSLPSRFVSDALLPSPSSFFPEWGFGRSGHDSNMLPSPLTFPTPAIQNGPSFSRDEEQDKKRKTPEGGTNGEGAAKKAKT
ncbi:hypothetical protein BJX99DRAFT_3538 [Aspergillus californicus]